MDESCDFTGWATKYNIRCADGRTIRPDSFAENDGAFVPLVWNHGHNRIDNVAGKVLLHNMPEGVYCEGICNDTSTGQRAKKMIKHGDITALSICANNLKQTKVNDADKIVTHGMIREVSLVLAGCNPGACIESVICHSADGLPYESYDEAIIYNEDNSITLYHADQNKKEKDMTEKNVDEKKDDSAESKKSENDEKTVQDVLDDMTEEQRAAVAYLVGTALEKSNETDNDSDEEEVMSHNVFDNTGADDNETLEHALGMDCSVEKAIEDMRRYGSLKQSFLAHNADIDNLVGSDTLMHGAQSYGIENIDYLFPDYKTTSATPTFVKRNTEWVDRLMNAVSHTPFSRVKSVFANITADEARARGYIKGKQKKEEVFPLLKRTTDPQTIYKKQKLDRDDIIDITDMDVVNWLRQEMRMMLMEEIARAILIGDGRADGTDDKISETHIRSVLNDDAFYSIKVTQKYAEEPDNNTFAADLEENVVYAFEDYEGAGNPLMFTTQHNLNILLMQKDKMGRRIYKTKAELCAALGVADIVPVQLMKGLKRTPGTKETTLTGKTMIVDAVIVNPSDYNVGTDKGGQIAMFDDFDIDYNQEKYLIETRMSGALTVPYSAMVVEHYIEAGKAAGDHTA